jgi:predicted amidohydrolase YtcJ
VYDAVAEGAAAAPPGTFVIGSRYDQNKLGGAHPTRDGLDRAAGDRPVWLRHVSGHMSVVNTAVLERIGDRLTEAGMEGAVGRGEDGAPTGLLQEQAQGLVRDLVVPYPASQLAGALARAHRRYVAEGVTAVCDAGIGGGLVGHSGVELAAYQAARDQGGLLARTTAMVAAEALHPLAGHADDGLGTGLDLGLRTGLGDPSLRLGAVKVFADGSLIGRTCAMHEGFADAPTDRGLYQLAPDELRGVVLAAHRSGWQVAIHAIGDAAVDLAVDAYARALQAVPRPGHRHRIEHCGVTSRATLARIAALGVVPVPQGGFVSELGDGMARALGPERTRAAYRLASFLEAGVPLPGSSDRPVIGGAPLSGIQDMVNRRTGSGAAFSPEEAVGPEQALRAWTWGSAYACFAEAEAGTLAPGKLADLVVLGDDPTTADPARIAEIEVLATLVGGQVVHDRLGLGEGG